MKIGFFHTGPSCDARREFRLQEADDGSSFENNTAGMVHICDNHIDIGSHNHVFCSVV